jgi:thiazole synthase
MAAIWHCFGNYMHRVDLGEVLAMLEASGTNVVPVNTHELDSRMRPEDLRIGFGSVSYAALAAAHDLSPYILMANINHQTSAAAAVEKTLLAVEMTGIATIKLEVLSDDLSRSNDAALIDAVRTLRQRRPDLRIMPLLSNDPIVAKELADAGCPLLRVMGGPIGSGTGIADEAAFAKCCNLGVPVVLDGGIGAVEDYLAARRLGAAGCLVNSMLFDQGVPPSRVLRDFVEGALREPVSV